MVGLYDFFKTFIIILKNSRKYWYITPKFNMNFYTKSQNQITLCGSYT